MASMGKIASNTGWPPSGSLYMPTTEPPAFSTAAATSAVGPSALSNKDSPGVKPFVPGFTFRGRRRAGARLAIKTILKPDPLLNRSFGCELPDLAQIRERQMLEASTRLL